MRLCVNTGCALHLIEPLGFDLSEKQVKRANLDYEMSAAPKCYSSFEAFETTQKKTTIYLCTTKATTVYSEIRFNPGDTFVFGSETRGLPEQLLSRYPDTQKIIIPMQPNSRSLNLANSAAIVLYEAWRQQHFHQSGQVLEAHKR